MVNFLYENSLTITGLILSIISILLTLEIRKKRKIHASIITEKNEFSNDDNNPEISLIGKAINLASISTIILKNVGKNTIYDFDIKPQRKIRFWIDEKFDILDVQIIGIKKMQRSAIITHLPSPKSSDKVYTLNFKSLHKGEEILIKIKHTGNVRKCIKMDGKIIRGSKVHINNYRKPTVNEIVIASLIILLIVFIRFIEFCRGIFETRIYSIPGGTDSKTHACIGPLSLSDIIAYCLDNTTLLLFISLAIITLLVIKSVVNNTFYPHYYNKLMKSQNSYFNI